MCKESFDSPGKKIPRVGRAVTKDQRGFEDGPNLYAYVHNNPLLEIDLYGEYAYFEQAKYHASRFGRAAFDFAYPCASAAHRLPPETPLWQKSALTILGGVEFGLTLNPLAKGAFTLGERAIIQVAKSAFSRQAERQMVRTAGKIVGIAAESQVSQQITKGAGLAKNLITKENSLNLDILSKAGQVMDRGGLTRAGRALDKHGTRPNSAFPKATGEPIAKNAQGQFHLDDILTHPQNKIYKDVNSGYEIYVPDGRGAYFRTDGTFRGFVENHLR